MNSLKAMFYQWDQVKLATAQVPCVIGHTGAATSDILNI